MGHNPQSLVARESGPRLHALARRSIRGPCPRDHLRTQPVIAGTYIYIYPYVCACQPNIDTCLVSKSNGR